MPVGAVISFRLSLHSRGLDRAIMHLISFSLMSDSVVDVFTSGLSRALCVVFTQTTITKLFSPSRTSAVKPSTFKTSLFNPNLNLVPPAVGPFLGWCHPDKPPQSPRLPKRTPPDSDPALSTPSSFLSHFIHSTRRKAPRLFWSNKPTSAPCFNRREREREGARIFEAVRAVTLENDRSGTGTGTGTGTGSGSGPGTAAVEPRTVESHRFRARAERRLVHVHVPVRGRSRAGQERDRRGAGRWRCARIRRRFAVL
ncbi:hypothetical protein J3F83DRAFT_700390 [Trichoderma novae-zelandiae]